MFGKQEVSMGDIDIKADDYRKDSAEVVRKQKSNTILKGSKLTGDIKISCDLELDGDVEGNITSEQKSNIVIKGNCKGDIKTKEGNVDIEGQISNGDIIVGGDVKITGKFSEGKIEAKGKIYVNGEFNGKLEGNEIDLGPRAVGKGDISYKESISIAKGAKIEANISQFQGVHKETRKTAETKVLNLEQPAKEITNAQSLVMEDNKPGISKHPASNA